tara:strand:- start:1966 stop:2169 length:204 start_codon:yes stop_codon:yes gene_type:complete
MYKSRLKKGVTKFRKNGLRVDWSNATQEQMKAVYEMGDNDLVTKEENAAPKKKEVKTKRKSKDNSTI